MAPLGLLARFLSVGALNTALGLAAILGLRWVGLSDVAANAIGYALGLVVSFTLNRKWTFGQRGAIRWMTVVLFGLVIAAAYASNLVTVLTLIRVAGLNPYIAQCMGIMPYTAVTFLGFRHLVFTERRAPG